MSVPIGKCRPLFEALVRQYTTGSGFTPVIPRYKLDIAIAGMLLTEEKNIFTEEDVKEKLTSWGYGVKGAMLTTLRGYLPTLVKEKVFEQIPPKKYKFNSKILEK
jgi:hypothetical protein